MSNSKPKPTIRLPRLRAPFYFGPEYLATAPAWKTKFTALLEELLKNSTLPWTVFSRYGDWTLTIRFHRTEFTMCACQGTFLIDEYDEELDRRDDFWSDNWAGPLSFPADFSREILDCPTEIKDEVGKISRFVDKLLAEMDRRFRFALKRGDARYEGRPASDQHPYQAIEADQFVGLIFSPLKSSPGIPGRGENIDFEDARGRAGHTWYSLCVVPTRPQLTQLKLSAIENKTSADERVQYPEDVYNPIIERCAKEVKRQFGKNATQAEVKRRATAEFENLGFKVPGKWVFDKRVKGIFQKK